MTRTLRTTISIIPVPRILSCTRSKVAVLRTTVVLVTMSNSRTRRSRRGRDAGTTRPAGEQTGGHAWRVVGRTSSTYAVIVSSCGCQGMSDSSHPSVSFSISVSLSFLYWRGQQHVNHRCTPHYYLFEAPSTTTAYPSIF